MRSIWCPSALGLRVVVSSACLCAACKVCQYPLCFMTVNASLLLVSKETLLRSQNLNMKWRSVRTKALLFWMFECIGWVLLVWIHQGIRAVLWKYSPLFSLHLQQKRNLDLFLQDAMKGKYKAKELFWFRLLTGFWWTCPHLCRRIKYQLPSPRLACGLREKPWCQCIILHRRCSLHIFPSEWYRNRKDVKTPQKAIPSSLRIASLPS